MSDADTGPGGISMTEYEDHRSRVDAEQLLWENNGWSLRGTAAGRDMLLWTSPYLLHGYPGGAFRLDSAATTQTLLMFADDPEAKLDKPNDFLAVGWEPDQFDSWNAWEVERTDDEVRWSGPGREVTTYKDRWTIGGDHAGVALDVTLTPLADIQWLSPPAEPLGLREDRWWVANARATGTITIEGSTFPIQAHGLHERHIHMGTSYNPVSLLRGEGVTWHSGHHPRVSYSVLARPDRGLWWAQVIAGDRTWDIREPSRITVRTEDQWLDPETWMTIPRRWELTVQDEGLSLQISTTAHARAYYLWNFLRDGITILYWWLCSSTVTIETLEGRQQLDRVDSEVHLNKTLYEGGPRNWHDLMQTRTPRSKEHQ